MIFTAKQIAGFLNGEVIGDPSVEVSTFSKIEEGRPGTLTFLGNPKYRQYIYETEADIVLVNSDFVPDKPIRATLIKVDNAYAALGSLMSLVEKNKRPAEGISTLAFVDSSAKVGDAVYIGEFAYVGKGCRNWQ